MKAANPNGPPIAPSPLRFPPPRSKPDHSTTSLTFNRRFSVVKHFGLEGRLPYPRSNPSDGVLRIRPRQIFEDVYVPLLVDSTPAQEQHSAEARYLGTARDIPRVYSKRQGEGGGRDPQPSPRCPIPHLTRKIAANPTATPRPPRSPGSGPPLPVVQPDGPGKRFSKSPDRAGWPADLANLGKRSGKARIVPQPVRPPKSFVCPQRLQHRGRAALQPPRKPSRIDVCFSP